MPVQTVYSFVPRDARDFLHFFVIFVALFIKAGVPGAPALCSIWGVYPNPKGIGVAVFITLSIDTASLFSEMYPNYLNPKWFLIL